VRYSIVERRLCGSSSALSGGTRQSIPAWSPLADVRRKFVEKDGKDE
jgi:hypothetical protein